MKNVTPILNVDGLCEILEPEGYEGYIISMVLSGEVALRMTLKIV
jgi:hypothetical protein